MAVSFDHLKSRDCPVCSTPAAEGATFLERKIDTEQFSPFSFASRKVPEYMNYKLLHCPNCDVVFACETPDETWISDAYSRASYDSKQEAQQAAEAYEKALSPYLSSMTDRNGVLDIGAGTGVFLQHLRACGFSGLTGVEPSSAAIAAADDDIKLNIHEGMFSAGNYEPASFSLICCFMTLEHVSDPVTLVRDCFGLLKPGGTMAAVVHDWRAWNNRLLGRHAPVVDIEHFQLFSKESIAELYHRCGFEDMDCRSYWNSYRIDYWNRLLPTPLSFKRFAGAVLIKTGIGRLRLSMNVGNLMIVARKP